MIPDLRVLVLCPGRDTEGAVLEHPGLDSVTGGYRARFLFDRRRVAGPAFVTLAEHGEEIGGLRVKTLRGALGLPLNLVRIVRLVRRFRPHLVFGHGRSMTPAAVLLGRLFCLPAASRLRELDPGRPERYRKFWIDRADGVVGISRATLGAYETLFPERSRLQVNAAILSGVNVSRLDSRAAELDFRERYGLPRDALLVGVSGRLAPQKGFEVVLRCAAAVEKRRDVVFVHIGAAGKRDYARRCLETRRALGLDEKVRMLGFVENPHPFYRAIDILLHPPSKEALGRVLLEAMAAGKPIVATAVDGIPEAVRHGAEGLLCDVDDEVRLVAELERLLGDAPLRRALGARGRARVEGELSSVRSAESYGRWFRDLVETGATSNGRAGTRAAAGPAPGKS